MDTRPEKQPKLRITAFAARGAHKILFVLKEGRYSTLVMMDYSTGVDRFEVGSRFKGTLHVNVSDLSWDGSYFLYSANGGMLVKDRFGIPKYDSWTAISKPPALKAEWIVPYELGGGGCFFEDRIHLYYDSVPDFARSKLRFFAGMPITTKAINYDNLSAKSLEYLRDYWQETEKTSDGFAVALEKTNGVLKLVKRRKWLEPEMHARYGKYDSLAYQIYDQTSGLRLEVASGEPSWADFDNLQRLVLCCDGIVKIFDRKLKAIDAPTATFDLKAMIDQELGRRERNRRNTPKAKPFLTKLFSSRILDLLKK